MRSADYTTTEEGKELISHTSIPWTRILIPDSKLTSIWKATTDAIVVCDIERVQDEGFEFFHPFNGCVACHKSVFSPTRQSRHVHQGPTLQLRMHLSHEKRQTLPWTRKNSVIHAVVGPGTKLEETVGRTQTSPSRWNSNPYEKTMELQKNGVFADDDKTVL